MKISKQQLENMIREELQKEVEEGFLGGMAKKLAGDVKGAATSGMQKAKRYGQDVVKAGKVSAAQDQLKKAKALEAAMQQKLQTAQGMVARAEEELQSLGVNPRVATPTTPEQDLAAAASVLPESKKKSK